MKRRRRGLDGAKELGLEITRVGSAWLIPGCTIVTSNGGVDDYCRKAAVAVGVTISGNTLQLEFFCDEHWR